MLQSAPTAAGPGAAEKIVLLTGGAGFIGRCAVEPLLARGYQVHMATRAASAEPRTDGVSIHPCDLFDAEQVQALIERVSPTHLLHFAWYAEPRLYWTSSRNLDCLRSSVQLLQTFARRGGRRAVFAGTCAEYDWSFGYLSETQTPTRPRTLYGACKHALQETTARFAETVNLSTAWGRIFFLYGPHEHASRFVPSIIARLAEGRAARCNYGRHLRDFLHVDDVAGAFVCLLDSDLRGPVNIASGVPFSLGQVAEMIALKLGRPELLEVDDLPAVPDNPVVLLADVTRLKTELGWSPRISLSAGLDQVLAAHAGAATQSGLKLSR